MSNDTDECLVEELSSDLQKSMKQFLDREEKILYCSQTNYRTSIFDSHHSAQVITEYKLIKVQRGHYGENTSIQLIDIQSISESIHHSPAIFSSTALGQGVAVTCYFRSRQASEKFTRILREVMENIKAIKQSTPTQHLASLEERLRCLTKLHEDGLVSNDEFQQKRKEILGEL